MQVVCQRVLKVALYFTKYSILKRCKYLNNISMASSYFVFNIKLVVSKNVNKD